MRVSSDGSETVAPPSPAPVPYADRKLPIGSTGFRPMAYPNDSRGAWTARVEDDGNLLALRPGPVSLWRMWPVVLLCAAWLGICLLAMTPRARQGRRIDAVMPTVLASAVCVVAVVAVVRSWRQPRTPWIVVDRGAKVIHLPREKRDIPFADVVRLQVVTFGKVGWNGTSYHGPPTGTTGEVQIVFNDARGEQTWCFLSHPDPDAMRHFAASFRNATDIPVARAYPLTSGDWFVEAIDGAALPAVLT